MIRSKRYLLAILLLVYASNAIDRFAFGLVLQDIKSDLHLSDTQLGLLTGIAFSLFYAVLALPIARWADRGNRIAIISAATALWSAAVALCGAAANFLQLLLIRIGVAIGEAGLLPAANSVLADRFARAERPRAVSLFMLGAPVGCIVGFLATGWLNELYGWRMTFVILGVPGVLLALVVALTLRDPRREPKAAATDAQPALIEVGRVLWRQSTFRQLLLGFSVLAFFTYGVAQWQPAFFIRSYGLGTGELGMWLAGTYGVGGLIGTYWGGALASRYAPHDERMQFRAMALVIAAFGMLSAFIYLAPSYPIAFALLGLSFVVSATVSGPVFAALQTLVPAPMRAVAVALLYLFANLIGMGLGPLLAGTLSDLYRPWLGEESLRYALLSLCPGYLWSAWHLWRASRTVVSDVAAVEAYNSGRRMRTDLKAAVAGCSAIIACCAWHGTADAADDLSKPIRVSEDGHFLVQPDGEPFFWLGDTAWELLHRLERDETEAYLDDRAAKGFNVIQLVVTGKIDLKALEAPNRYGDMPFDDQNPLTPNERYFQYLDWVVDAAARRQIRVALLPTWALQVVSEEPLLSARTAEQYGRWLGARYRGKGVIWMLGGDILPVWPVPVLSPGAATTLTDFRPVFDALAAGITAGEGADPFITYHPCAGSPLGAAAPRTSLYFGDRSWFDMNMIQSSHLQAAPGDTGGGSYRTGHERIWSLYSFVWNNAYGYAPIAAEYESIPVRPVIDGEPTYESSAVIDGNAIARHFSDAAAVRRAAYHALFAGAAGHTYGHFSIWNFHNPDRPSSVVGDYDRSNAQYDRPTWREALAASGAGQMQYVKGLLLSRPYFSRIPDQALIDGDAGQGKQHIAATRDRDGTYAMVYIPQGQPVTVDLARLSGSALLGSWFNPRTGAVTKMRKTFSTRVKSSFVPPTRAEGQDWVLVLERAHEP